MLHRPLRNICILVPELLKKALNMCCCCNIKKLHFARAHTHTHTHIHTHIHTHTHTHTEDIYKDYV